ncbi:hypothetical protein [Cardinium endosymbiont of Nabis limbatus]|uniref:hypothetical protein n=1 Tax=Cardinium endosymbiont of Nabis limbatus TaxID=3066217 RepID=UPI003AF3D511
MKVAILKFETELKFIAVIAFWGIRWLYAYLTASNESMSNMEPEELEQLKERDETVQNGPDTLPPIATAPIAEKIVATTPPAVALPPLAIANHPLLQSTAIENRKTALRSKRKLFRNILLVDALMQRKGFIA